MPILFKNKGIIPIEAIKTFGVSVKETDDAIGFFGTGLKYAIAIFLRNNCRVTAFIDGEEIEFFTGKGDVRGTEFDFVFMGTVVDEKIPSEMCHQLAFTTDLGKHWEPWMAFRELYCNAVDEGGCVEWCDERYDAVAQSNETVFMVDGHTAYECWRDRQSTILTTPPIHEGSLADAHIGVGKHLYYRSVRVADLGTIPAKYDYNVTHQVELTEDRTLKYQFTANRAVMSLILGASDPLFIRNCLRVDLDARYYEDGLVYGETSMTPSDTFLDVVEEMYTARARMNFSAIRFLHKYRDVKLLPENSIKLNKVETSMLEKALNACSQLGCNMERYPVIIADHLGQGVLGQASREYRCIYISNLAFNGGTKIVTGTLFEEYLHLDKDLDDMTREMQNWLIDKVMSMHEELIGEPL